MATLAMINFRMVEFQLTVNQDIITLDRKMLVIYNFIEYLQAFGTPSAEKKLGTEVDNKIYCYLNYIKVFTSSTSYTTGFLLARLLVDRRL